LTISPERIEAHGECRERARVSGRLDRAPNAWRARGRFVFSGSDDDDGARQSRGVQRMIEEGLALEHEARFGEPTEPRGAAARKDDGVEGEADAPALGRVAGQAADSGSRKGLHWAIGFSSSLICHTVPTGGLGANRSFHPISDGV
jgi:hypothetical protein